MAKSAKRKTDPAEEALVAVEEALKIDFDVSANPGISQEATTVVSTQDTNIPEVDLSANDFERQLA